jgi:hypothetical protein
MLVSQGLLIGRVAGLIPDRAIKEFVAFPGKRASAVLGSVRPRPTRLPTETLNV